MATENNKEVSCTLCSSPFSDPRLLPCLHVYCKCCLESLVSQNEAGTLTCPSCYKITPDCTPSQLPRHIKKERDAMLVKIQEQLSSENICGCCEEKSVLEAFCEDCASLICSGCADSHKRYKPMRNHTIVSFKSDHCISHNLPQCSIHNNESVRFYCSSCTCLVCSECISDHKEHEWELVKDAAESEKEEIIVVLPYVEDAITPITGAIEEVDNATESVNTKREELKENIRETFDKIIDIAKKRRSELLEEVDKASLAKTTQLDMQREGLVKIKDALQLTLDTGTTVCSQYDSVELLAVKGYIQTALKSYFDEAQSVELSPVCCNDLTYVADENMLESLRNYGEVILPSNDDENEDDSEEEEPIILPSNDDENEDDSEGKWEEEPMMEEEEEEEEEEDENQYLAYLRLNSSDEYDLDQYR